MSLPDKCPFCDAGPGPYVNNYLCGTFMRPNVANRVHQTKMCIVSERARLSARVAELEARCKRLEEAGDILGAAADAADIDIGQHLQVANYNLHGLLNTGDRVNPPNPPHTIHQDGIDESVMVRQKVRQARQAWKQAKEAKP